MYLAFPTCLSYVLFKLRRPRSGTMASDHLGYISRIAYALFYVRRSEKDSDFGFGVIRLTFFDGLLAKARSFKRWKADSSFSPPLLNSIIPFVILKARPFTLWWVNAYISILSWGSLYSSFLFMYSIYFITTKIFYQLSYKHESLYFVWYQSQLLASCGLNLLNIQALKLPSNCCSVHYTQQYIPTTLLSVCNMYVAYKFGTTGYQFRMTMLLARLSYQLMVHRCYSFLYAAINIATYNFVQIHHIVSI